jgi:hypothetical protein
MADHDYGGYRRTWRKTSSDFPDRSGTNASTLAPTPQLQSRCHTSSDEAYALYNFTPPHLCPVRWCRRQTHTTNRADPSVPPANAQAVLECSANLALAPNARRAAPDRHRVNLQPSGNPPALSDNWPGTSNQLTGRYFTPVRIHVHKYPHKVGWYHSGAELSPFFTTGSSPSPIC